jgi:LuxR family maltose regulon positive regulatory protein
VARPRLTRLLDEARAPAVLLVAPPGYGKTILVREWAEGRKHVVWYRATAASADLATLSVAVAEAIEPLVPGTSARLRQRVREGVGEDWARVLAEFLAPALEDWPADGVLVIDDYHLVQASRPAEELVDWLLTMTPLRLVVTTRTRPSWASARRVLYGDVVEIDRSQLAFTDDEAREVLGGLSAPEARAAITSAQGWPALVTLAALTGGETPERFAGDALYRYLADEVLQKESPDVQRFMTVASVPLTLDDETLAMLGLAGSQAIVARLVDEGLLEQVGMTYRFHPLLREFLRRKLIADQPELAVTLADAAATHAATTGRVEEAFELARESGRSERAAQIAAEAARELLVAGRVETVERWLEACGPAALLQPALVVARAAILLRRGELMAAGSLALDVARRLGDDDPQASRAWYLAAQSHQLLSRWVEARRYARRAAATALTREDRLNALLLTVLSAAAVEDDATDELSELETLAANDLRARFRLASAELRTAFASPSVAGTWERVAALIPLADHCEGPMLKSDVLAGAAYLNVLRAEYDTAAALAVQAAGVAADAKLRLPHAFSTLYLAAAEAGRRRFSKAERIVRRVEDVASTERPSLRLMLEIVRLRIALGRGDALEPTARDDLAVEDASARVRALYAALSAFADDARSAELADEARASSRSAEAQLYAAFADLVREVRAGEDVAPELATLLERARAADVVDPFVVAYRVEPELLALAASDPRIEAFARTTALRVGDEELAQHAGLVRTSYAWDVHDVLTPRELEVLELLAEGLSNAEIARRLYISPSTTKVHVHHILEKLGSKSRFEAVVKASRSGTNGGGG